MSKNIETNEPIELLSERVHLVLSPSMLSRMKAAQHAAGVSSLNEWVRRVLGAALVAGTFENGLPPKPYSGNGAWWSAESNAMT